MMVAQLQQEMMNMYMDATVELESVKLAGSLWRLFVHYGNGS